MSSGAIAQRRQGDGEDVQPVEEIAPELPARHHLRKVAVRRRDDPDVDLHGLASRPRRSNSRSCSTRRSFDLRLRAGARRPRRETAFPVGELEAPDLRRWTAPVNAPFSCPNSSLSRSPAEIAAQFTFTSGRSRRGLRFVNGPRDQLLARAGLAEDEDARSRSARPSRPP